MITAGEIALASRRGVEPKHPSNQRAHPHLVYPHPLEHGKLFDVRRTAFVSPLAALPPRLQRPASTTSPVWVRLCDLCRRLLHVPCVLIRRLWRALVVHVYVWLVRLARFRRLPQVVVVGVIVLNNNSFSRWVRLHMYAITRPVLILAMPQVVIVGMVMFYYSAFVVCPIAWPAATSAMLGQVGPCQNVPLGRVRGATGRWS